LEDGLKQADVDKLVVPGKHLIDRGLYLQIISANARSWLFRYTFHGKAHWHGIGSARDVTLKQALDAVADARALIRKGVDPVADRKNAKLQVRAQERAAVTFRVRAEQFLLAHESEWRNEKHRNQWRATLRNYVYPAIGDLPTIAVTAGHIVDLLRPIWSSKQETARRVRGRIEAVLDFSADPDDHNWRNPAAAAERLLKALPKVRRQIESHPALPYSEVAAFVGELRQREGTAAAALEFAILTAARTTEVLGATLQEIDLEKRLWTVPPRRMKGGREHRVPLSNAAVAILERAKTWQQGAFLFPSLPHDKPLSNMAMATVVKRGMKRGGITVHGFRSTFRDWASEQTNFPNEVAEAALAHVIENKTEAAYRRGDLFEKRRALMDEWAAYCARGGHGKAT
jgi:integrase